MPLVAVVTLIGTALTVAVLALYLIRVALLLRHVAARLSGITAGLAEVVRKTEPVNPVVGEINDDLAQADGALRSLLSGGGAAPAGAVSMRGGPAGVRSGSLAAAVSSGARPAAVSTAHREPVAVGAGEPGPADMVWGIRSAPGITSLPQKFAALAGTVYVAIGVIGFFSTGFGNFTEDVGHQMFWYFGVTPFHNIVHLGVGGLWLLAAFLLTPVAAEGLNFGIAGVYVLAAILGFLGDLSFLGIRSGYAPDNFLHLITGVVSLLFAGLFGGLIGGGARTDRGTHRVPA